MLFVDNVSSDVLSSLIYIFCYYYLPGILLMKSLSWSVFIHQSLERRMGLGDWWEMGCVVQAMILIQA